MWFANATSTTTSTASGLVSSTIASGNSLGGLAFVNSAAGLAFVNSAGGSATANSAGGFATTNSAGGFAAANSAGGFAAANSAGGFATTNSAGGSAAANSAGGFVTACPARFDTSVTTTALSAGPAARFSSPGAARSSTVFGCSLCAQNNRKVNSIVLIKWNTCLFLMFGTESYQDTGVVVPKCIW